jgi:hypothetical protein
MAREFYPLIYPLANTFTIRGGTALMSTAFATRLAPWRAM